MIDQKLTGVFVQLPLSSADIQKMDQAMSKSLQAHAKPTLENTSEVALLAIGIPVHGVELERCGYARLRETTNPNTWWTVCNDDVPFYKSVGYRLEEMTPINAAQAQIAALEAEAVRLREELAESRKKNFNAGYLIACCNLFNMHNEEGMAADILAEATITEEEVKALGLSEYDAAALVEIRKSAKDDPILKGSAA
jgi:hypothetical protein